MEKIHERKPQTNTGPHRLQELSHLHDDEGTKRTTRTMDVRIKSIQLQKLNTDEERKEVSQTPSQEEMDTYPRQETRDSLETWESYCQKNDTGISPKLKKSTPTYWKQRNSKTRTRERYRRQATSTMRSKTSRETWTKEEKK